MNARLTAAQRLVRRYGGTYGNGTWDRASGLTEEKAIALAGQLMVANYQVKKPFRIEKSEKFEVLFR